MAEEFYERNMEIANRYIRGDIPMSLLSKQYGVSRERIRQIVERAYPEYRRPHKVKLSIEEKKKLRLQRRIQEFWDLTELKENGCLEWIGCIHPVSGYGIFNLSLLTHTRYTHRISWIITNGLISQDLKVLHKCDNPVCVNPDHLYVGTQADNIRDREERFRGIIPQNRDKHIQPRRSVSNFV